MKRGALCVMRGALEIDEPPEGRELPLEAEITHHAVRTTQYAPRTTFFIA